ncbi:MAG: slipin family protein [Cellvibrionaceae bacterium]|nr:slipin family protein [Cellvibrionaceae bacterium]
MLLWKTINIADNQKALLYRNDCFARVLEPGRHRIETLSGELRLETYDITRVVFDHKNAKFLMNAHANKLSAFLERVELTDTQVGLVYRDRHLADVLAPGSFYAFWKNVEQVRIEIIDIDEDYQIDEKLIGLLARGLKVGDSKEVIRAISYNEVPDEHVGLMLVNGKLEKILKPGTYGFWKYNRSVIVKLLDMRLQATEVNGQEILTKDRVSLRVNLSASYRISDAKIVALKLNDYVGFIYRELQLRLREAVGTKTLDQLLEDKDSLNAVIAESVREKFKEYGIVLQSVGVKDIVLPGDMKVILNQVVEAQKAAEANVIKRREETQAMRSLHNTAKMMENNPTLLRLKELESLERVTERIDKISVYGGLDAVLNDLVKLAPSSRS